MKISINKLALIKRCSMKGHLSVSDVTRYYPFRSSAKCLGVLEKMEIMGLLVQVNKYNWELTVKGKEALETRLNPKKEVNQ